jgi:hypothetical protein
MRAHRLLIALLVLIVGFLLTKLIFGRHTSIDNIPVQSKTMLLSPSIGDTLTWRRPSSQITELTLTIPGELCALTPTGRQNSDGTMTVTVTGDAVVTCKVLPPPKDEGDNPIFFYTVELKTGRQPSSSSYGLPRKPTIIMVPTIVGSCDGCGVLPRVAGSVSSDQALYQVKCQNNVPTVDPITIGSDVGSIGWGGKGTWTVTFSDSTIPCTNGPTVTGGLTQCTINPDARPKTGDQAKSYDYSVSLSSCNGGKPADLQSLTINP